MNDILTRVKSISHKDASRLGLVRIARDLGLTYSADIYPEVINLARCKNDALKDVFGRWPLPVATAVAPVASISLSLEQKRIMAEIYDKVTDVTSEKFPYTDEFEVFCNAFVSRTGLDLSRNDIWCLLSNLRKRGQLPRKGRK